jgi:hypothetical protein
MDISSLIMPILNLLPLKYRYFNQKSYFNQLQENIDRCKDLHGLIVPCPLQFGAECPQFMKKLEPKGKDNVCCNCRLFGTETEEIVCQSKKHQIKPFYDKIRSILIRR